MNELVFTPSDPNYKNRIKSSFDQQGLMAHLGVRLIEVKPGYCEMEIDHDDRLSQQHGYFHAGVISTLADNAAGYAAYSLMDAQSEILTVEFKINFLSPAKGSKLLVQGMVLKPGKTLTIARSEIFSVNHEGKKLCALAQVTLMRL